MNELAEPRVTANGALADAPCFIERQFPVAKVSAESYKERDAKTISDFDRTRQVVGTKTAGPGAGHAPWIIASSD